LDALAAAELHVPDKPSRALPLRLADAAAQVIVPFIAGGADFADSADTPAPFRVPHEWPEAGLEFADAGALFVVPNKSRKTLDVLLANTSADLRAPVVGRLAVDHLLADTTAKFGVPLLTFRTDHRHPANTPADFLVPDERFDAFLLLAHTTALVIIPVVAGWAFDSLFADAPADILVPLVVVDAAFLEFACTTTLLRDPLLPRGAF